jgi:hypothetical protein
MFDPKEERNWHKVKELATKLHIPLPEVFWEFEVFDRDGNRIQHYKQRSHSWVRNAYNLLFCQLASLNPNDSTYGPGQLNIKLPSGSLKYSSTVLFVGYSTNYSVESDATKYRGYRGGAGEDTVGIMVGSGTNPESFEDYNLQTKIANGSGAGQLSYVGQEAMSESYVDTTKKNTMVRYFNNNSGGNVAVNEVGLCTEGIAGNSMQQVWLQCRDKLATTVTVPDTGQLKVTYVIQLTYPV